MTSTNDQQLEALAQLYKLAGMHDQPIDTGIADEFCIPREPRDAALLLAAVTMHHHQVDTEVRDIIAGAFGVVPNFKVIEEACTDVLDAFQDHNVSPEVLDLTDDEKAWVRGVLWESTVVRDLSRNGLVSAPSGEKRDTVPWPEWDDDEDVRYIDDEDFYLEEEGPDIEHRAELLALLRACGFTDEHRKIPEEDLARMGEYLIGRFSSLFRLIQEKHPHLPPVRQAFGDNHLRKWLKRNTKKLDAFADYDQQVTLVAFLLGTELADIDLKCGGVVLTGKGIQALSNPKLFVESVLKTLPYALDDTDFPVALMDAMIAYLGPEKAERALKVPASELAEMIHQYTHRPETMAALHAYSRNYMVRQFLGVQVTKPFTMEHDQLTAMGKLIYKYGIASAMEPALSFADFVPGLSGMLAEQY